MGSGSSGLTLSRPLKIDYKPVTRVENFCATGSEAFRNACYAVAVGRLRLRDGGRRREAQGLGLSRAWSLDRPEHDGTALGSHARPRCSRCSPPPISSKYGVERRGHARGADAHRLEEPPQRRAERARPVPQGGRRGADRGAPIVAGRLGVFDCSGVSDGAAAAIIVRAEDAHQYTDTPMYVKALSFVAGPGDGPLDPDYDYTTFREVVALGRGRLRAGRHQRSARRRSRWPRCTTASPRPSWS